MNILLNGADAARTFACWTVWNMAVMGAVSTSLNAGTPAENLCRKPAVWFDSPAGQETMRIVLSWQSDHGDWPKNTDTTNKVFSGDRSTLRGTFDNGATTGELRLLAHAFQATNDPRYKQAFVKGLDHILNAQYANGGWPQYFPLRKGYYTHITFNDNCMIRLLQFLGDIAAAPEFGFLDQEHQRAAQKAIDRGIDCIVKCQIVVNGTATVWCAQHDEVTLAAAKARAYELPSLSGAESAGILKYLMSLDNPDAHVIRCVHDGVGWFETAKIDGFRYQKSGTGAALTPDPSARPLWARFYEIESNRPFFCDRDGIPKYDIQQIGSERRSGYTWYGNWGESLINQFAKWEYR
ncbi:Pectic acid lyase [Rubripirellula lacrimiformis]|uniref:Pectic acid lyase n=1 Tax=Rubripirellula lacrimiformis TaxID=1930273 RepID=A0A517NH80_9BACT|nr:pectate lyase [Rubripirellula lacrimiformis]QDT06494.1 Pectic acid lyase [Rubripirellula lacrimiformis]